MVEVSQGEKLDVNQRGGLKKSRVNKTLFLAKAANQGTCKRQTTCGTPFSKFWPTSTKLPHTTLKMKPFCASIWPSAYWISAFILKYILVVSFLFMESMGYQVDVNIPERPIHVHYAQNLLRVADL